MSKHPCNLRGPSLRKMRGVSLIELMIAMLLGLVVVAAAGGLFLTNKRVYASTETLNRIQENTRVSFEIMSRDIREAGGRPCGGTSQLVNLLNSKDSAWWTGFEDGLHGYDAGQAAPGTATGTGLAQRAPDTDAIDLHMSNDGDYSVQKHDTPSATLDLNKVSGLAKGDIALVCNTAYSLIFQITDFAGNKVLHGGGNGNPGNCGQEFQYEEPGAGSCSGASNPFGYCMMGATSAQCVKSSEDPAALVKLGTVRWYIGNNARGSQSLYRARVINKTLTAVPDIIDPVEIAEGVSQMQLEYRSLGSPAFVPASSVSDWTKVNAVRISLTAQGVEGALRGSYVEGTEGDALSRDLTHVVAIRNREGVL